jgi:hypothetical protein
MTSAAPDASNLTAAPLSLWLTDRSRYKLGTGRCARARYLGYHFGPTGYGITSRSDSLPLATGQYVHQGIEAFMGILQRSDALPSADETRAIVANTRAQYEARVEARGFRGILAGPMTDETVQEQSALISGLLWALRLKFLPWFHQQYRVVWSEVERLHILECTCGASPLQPADHIARGCEGKALMIRNDIIAQRRGAQTLAYFEAKTTGWESDAWAEQWETDPQLGMGTLDVDQLVGAEVTELYIIGLSKGARRRDKADGPDGRRKQMSALTYGYCRPGNPPLATDDWLPGYEWTDAAGDVKRASRAHRRRGVWEIAESDWPTWAAYRGQDPGLTPEEFWVRTLPASVLDKVCFLLGPMNRQDAQLSSLRRSLIGEEHRWQANLWALYEVQQAFGWATEEFQAALDRLVPCSFQCRPFGKDHQCEFVPICFKHEGWQDPLATGKYQPRLPHHVPEQLQAAARGLIVSEAAERDEEEGERA